MAHFAQLDENNLVTQVIVISNNDCGGGEFPESEEPGQKFISDLGLEGVWKQTSYNSKFRKLYAGIGYSYNSEHDIFVSPRPFASWELDENFDWQPPIPIPESGVYFWNEDINNWEQVIDISVE